jgi:2-dehydro-3-deoxygalactonokinase
VTRLLALDWGTSSLRGALLAPDGAVLEERSFSRGILTIAKGGFPAVFESCFGDWMNSDALCLISGMAGSQQGWLEAPYCACPAGFDDIASGLSWVDHGGPGRIAIVPGLSIEKNGLPDVMRGEETQVFGALQLLGLDEARLVLPGTHSKWVTVNHRRVTDFSTWMTGEFYALLRQHSILSRTLPESEPEHDRAAFEQGVAQALRGDGLLHTAFSTRTLALFKRMPGHATPSYLSGLVIGEELKCQSFPAGQTITVMGAEILAARYEQALAYMGVPVRLVSSSTTWQGLFAIAKPLL